VATINQVGKKLPTSTNLLLKPLLNGNSLLDLVVDIVILDDLIANYRFVKISSAH